MKKALYLLGQLSDADVEWMIRDGRRQTIPPNFVLIREGMPIDAVYIVLDGLLQVTGSGLGGAVIRLGCGEVVGEMSFVDARPPSATVTAATNAIVLAIPRRALAARLEQDATTLFDMEAMADGMSAVLEERVIRDPEG